MPTVDGHAAAGFERVVDVFAAHIPSDGAAFCAIQDGTTLIDLWGGFADRTGSRPWARDTLVPVYSATKPIAALAVAWARDHHRADLFETRISDLWPEFGTHGKGQLTVAQFLAHQAGVPGFAAPIDPVLWLDPPALAQVVAALAPLWPPGSASGYHPTTWGYVVGEIVRRVAGRSLGAILREEFCAPREIDFWIGLPESEDTRVAEMRRPTKLPDLGSLTALNRAAFLEKWSGPDRNDPRWRRVEIPSANGHGTARALAQLYALYAERGAYAGARVLSWEAHAALTQRIFDGQDLVLPFVLDWRAGILGNNLGFLGPSPTALGHYGWGGACGVADSDLGLSIGFVTNTQSHHLMGDPRARALIYALYQCLG